MIGARAARPWPWPMWPAAALAGVAVVVGMAVLFGLRSPDARLADPARVTALENVTQEAAEDADAALARLQAELNAALAHARRGSAATLAGEASPAGPLVAAADRLVEAASAAVEAERRIVRLAGILGALSPGEAAPDLPLAAVEVEGIAAQLRAAAPAAEAFAEQRRMTATTIEALGRAVAALDGDELDEAFGALAEARSALEVVRAWEAELVTLPIWIDTTAALIDAAEQLGRAAARGDEEAAAAAAEAYAVASEEAHHADLALGVAIAEGANGVAAAPLQRLAEALRGVAGSRAAVASVLHPETSLAR